MKIAILTTFMEFNPGYSLTGIVKDQVQMLTRYGHEVALYVNEQYHGETAEQICESSNFSLKKEIPFAHLKDYKSIKELKSGHQETVDRTTALVFAIGQYYDMVFTHDLVFTGWNMPYALGIQQAAKFPEVQSHFLHWIHSVTSGFKDWWNIREYGNKHKLVYPNESDRLRVAENYQGAISDVMVIPHIKDMRTWFEFAPETCEFIDAFPGVMQAQIVQILPASVDRLHAKRVNEVILLFSRLKEKGFSVCLVVADQWATSRTQKEEVGKYLKVASRNGLNMMDEVIFTSEWQVPKYDTGIPRRMLRELFQCSNLFVFPTREESFGLVVPEASLSGGVLLCLNKSLNQQIEISGMTTLYFDFGSFHNNFEPKMGWNEYMNQLSSIIIYRMQQNESIMSKTFMRMQYNMDSLYRTYYEPIMWGSITW